MTSLQEIATSARLLASQLRERFPIAGEGPPKRRANGRALVPLYIRLQHLRMLLPDKKAAMALCGPGTTWQQLDALESVLLAVAEIEQCYGLDKVFDGTGPAIVTPSEMLEIDPASVRDLEAAADELDPPGTAATTTPEEGYVFMNAAQAGKYVGVTPRTIQNWNKGGTLTPKRKIGNEREYSLTELNAKRESRTKKPAKRG